MSPRRILIKIGGRAFAGQEGFDQLAQGIRDHSQVAVIIVHGGGAEISQALKAAQRPTQFIDGIRVTQAEDIRIVDQVLSETVNARIAGWLEAEGVSCRRLAGKSRNLLLVTPLAKKGHDFGYVGQVAEVHPQVVEEALAEQRVPVISPISADSRGALFNVNADSAAAALAAGLHCTDLVFITDVPGVQVDGQTCVRLEISQTQKLIESEIIQGGMVAKIQAGQDALEKGVPRVHILAWQGVQTFRQIVAGGRTGGTVLVCK
ncbi:MAG: acetylglutamate kinase [Desulfobacterales bacterium]